MEIKKCLILASGEGSRMRYLGNIYPKCILPVGNKIPLIEIIKYLNTINPHEIEISCQPESREIIEYVISKADIKNTSVSCNSDSYSPNIFESFNRMLDYNQNILLILGDIFYLENPFSEIINVDTTHDIVMGTELTDNHELSRGGIIAHKNTDVQLISKVGIINDQVPINYARWSGAAYCGDSFKKDLEYLIDNNLLHSLEDIFEYRRSKYCDTKFLKHGEFVNLNTPTHLLLSSILEFSTDNTTLISKKTRSELINISLNIRKDIYKHSLEQI